MISRKTSSKILDKETKERRGYLAFPSAQSVKHRLVALIEADRIGAVNRQECRPVKSLPSYAIIIVAVRPVSESQRTRPGSSVSKEDLRCRFGGPAQSSRDCGPVTCRPFASGQVVSARINESARLSVVRVNWRPRVFLLATRRIPNLLTWSMKKERRIYLVFFSTVHEDRSSASPPHRRTMIDDCRLTVSMTRAVGKFGSDVVGSVSFLVMRMGWGFFFFFFIFQFIAFNCNLIIVSRIL